MGCERLRRFESCHPDKDRKGSFIPKLLKFLNSLTARPAKEKQKEKITTTCLLNPMDMYSAILMAGFSGGVIRGLVGFIKHQYAYKDVGFNLPYFLAMILLSGLIGFVTAISVQDLGVNLLGINYLTPGLAIIIGYAGGDFLENLYKIIFKKSSVYLPSGNKK